MTTAHNKTMQMQIQTSNTISYLQGLLIILIIIYPVGGTQSAVDNWSLFEDFLDKNNLNSGIFCPCGWNGTSYEETPRIIDKMKRLNKRISFVYPPKQRGTSLHSHGIFADAGCLNLDEYLKFADDYKLFRVQYKWLLAVEEGQLENVLSRFEDFDINVSSDINLAVGG